MPASEIFYGVANGELVHVDDVVSGLACACRCPECGRALMAKKGPVLVHHFAHVADDSNCKPTPESLVHRYAKQQLAKLSNLVLPGFIIDAQHTSSDGQAHHAHWRHQPYYRLKVSGAQVEAEVNCWDGVKVIPDVLFDTQWGQVALEVFFRHQVSEGKIRKLSNSVHVSTLEVSLNDLPVEASSATINAALADLKRWRWLHNQHEKYLNAQIVRLLAMSTRIFVPEASTKVLRRTQRTVPSTKLMQAANMGGKVAAFLKKMESRGATERSQLVRQLDSTTRIALHCRYLQISPLKLPLHLMQTVENGGAMGMHPVVWQTGVFAKFCMNGGEFSAQDVETWVRKSIEDKAFNAPESITQSTNGFSPMAEGAYHFLRNLAAQGLLKEIPGQRPWSSKFAPIAASKAEICSLLLSQAPAIEVAGNGV